MINFNDYYVLGGKWLLQSRYIGYLARRMDLVVSEIPVRGIDQQISQGGSLLTIYVPVDPSSFPQATHSRRYGNGCVRGGYKDLSAIC